MNKRNRHITIFEHETLKVGREYSCYPLKEKVLFTEKHRMELEAFYGEKGNPYYSLIHKGVQFNEHVGVLHLGNLIIEVLPKADKYSLKNEWQDILIGMMRAVGAFNIHAPSSTSLKVKSNFILDLYFELFVKEVEFLFNKGLIKKYRKTEGNRLALKGSLQFGKHIQQNLVHQERFYVKHTTYDNVHVLHQALYKTLLLLKQLNAQVALSSRIGNLLLNFPEMNGLVISEKTFDKIILTRKTVGYKNAIEISKLLLLNYHPDLSSGKNNVLALMFDMNLLWEQFIYVSLRKQLKSGVTISKQTSKDFWKPTSGSRSTIIPDIVIKMGEDSIVLDTKWKNIGDKNPSPEDLRQLFVYHEYFNAKKVALVYPGIEKIISGDYFKTDKEMIFENNIVGKEEEADKNRGAIKTCSIIRIPTNTTISSWQNEICKIIFNKWLTNDYR